VSVSGDGGDAALIAAMAEGDEDAFSSFYRRYLPLVTRWCLRETGSRELAADLSAEVFAAAITACRRYRAEEGAVSGWLLGIARNKARDSRRRGRVENSARRRLGVQPIAFTDLDLERVEAIASLSPELQSRLQSLPGEQREALVRRVVLDRSYEEIAGELRCSESVVRQRVSRALKTLKSQLEEQ
jgi:RNA polymerase sigma factor (sigma-70 family)